MLIEFENLEAKFEKAVNSEDYKKLVNKINKAEKTLFSLIKRFSENKKITPKKPIKTPNVLIKLNFSFMV